MASTTVIRAPLSTSTLRLEPRPQVNAARLNATLHDSCQFGNLGPDGAGMSRLSLNEDDALVRRWLVEQLKDVECEVKVDEMGNMFGIFSGKDMTLPPIAIGSHLDTQPAGGRYDGILGVMCGLEIIVRRQVPPAEDLTPSLTSQNRLHLQRAVKESGYRTNAPLVCINWTNEEGARFVPTMLGSGVYAGKYDVAFGYVSS